MADARMWLLFSIGEVLLVGVLVLLLPRVTRRGLLFGAWVGAEAAASPRAAAITRGWYGFMGLTLAASAALGIGLVLLVESVWAGPLAQLVLFTGLAVGYVRAHLASRRLAPAEGPPPAVASLETPARPRLVPWATLVVCTALGALSVAYAVMHYDALPERIPTHFGLDGKPDAWSDKSWGMVLLLPLMTLGMGAGIAAVVFFVSRAKRALRLGDSGISARAQERFHRVMALYLGGIAVLVTAMLAQLSQRSIQVGLGHAADLSPAAGLLFGAMLLWTFGGLILVFVFVGQGGARLERDAGRAPLTDGLADNSRWKLGLLYVNPEDPSVFVEHRFGVGYTLNLGNRGVQIALGGLLLLALAAMLLPLVV